MIPPNHAEPPPRSQPAAVPFAVPRGPSIRNVDPRLETEVDRVMGRAGAVESEPETTSAAHPRVRLETAHAVYELPGSRLLTFPDELPDGVGVQPL